ncbi:hypothetical protein OBBRIDRAFT_805951 [Obba rivulosa]|uniref:Uncharacterized protein n=1 Tax=Obba rivulosa TaxID=1052685 RepID=A0A8E2AN46_9APHY|nr:hypothetical protein OBBRIDRAFT_805951 [Obba rivulosa]
MHLATKLYSLMIWTSLILCSSGGNIRPDMQLKRHSKIELRIQDINGMLAGTSLIMLGLLWKMLSMLQLCIYQFSNEQNGVAIEKGIIALYIKANRKHGKYSSVNDCTIIGVVLKVAL